jgi:hypothetical protein
MNIAGAVTPTMSWPTSPRALRLGGAAEMQLLGERDKKGKPAQIHNFR